MSINPNETKDLWLIGIFRLDGRARLLLKDGIPVPLTPKAFDVLLYLARSAGRAVPREELLDSIWPDSVVTDASLTQAVFLIRKALGETESPKIVETVPRIGYRFNLPDPVIPPPPGGGGEGGGTLRTGAMKTGPLPPHSLAAQQGGEEVPLPPDSLAPRQRGEGARRAGEGSPLVDSRFFAPVLVLALLGLGALGALLLRSGNDRLKAAVKGAGAPLLELQREIAVPPDTLRILGALDGTIVLAAPSAFYLLPADGALAASRVPLGPGEVAAWPLAADRLVIVKEGRVLSRHPAKPEESDLGELPAGSVAAREGHVLVSKSGRFLSLRGEDAFEVLERDKVRWVRRIRAQIPHVAGEVLDLTDRFIGLAQGRGATVRAWALPSGQLVLDGPFSERQVFTMAIDDASGQIAVGGPFDSVAVFSTSGPPGPRLIPRRGWTYGLGWVADTPTLLVSGHSGLAAWRGDAESPGALSDVGPSGGVHFDADFLLVHAPRRQRLAIVSYSGFPPDMVVPAGGRPLWGAEHDHEGETVFAGGQDGLLRSLDTSTLTVKSADVHTDGLPGLARDGDLLATSSDDKTVAVWQLPGPKLLLRSKAHDFLVNDLTIVADGTNRQLVTSSSDGTIKRWSWPDLRLLETVDVQKMAGRQLSFHAVWSAPGARRFLAGTWNSMLLEVTSADGQWRSRSFDVRSRAVYRFAAIPRLGLVLAVGILPSRILVFDLESGTLSEIDDAGLQAMWAVPVPDRDEVLVAGLDGVSRYAFSVSGSEGKVRTLSYQVWSRRQSGAGLQTATLLPGGALWAGTVKGDLVRYDMRQLEGPPLFTRTLELGR